MSRAAAAEYALLLTEDPARGRPEPPPGLARLSARERTGHPGRQGRATDAQIAARLYISVRTVRSHLDRIRDKTGCRRCADLTRLALAAELMRRAACFVQLSSIHTGLPVPEDPAVNDARQF
jgi:DNA-binding CsgD family transcriptional regulator